MCKLLSSWYPGHMERLIKIVFYQLKSNRLMRRTTYMNFPVLIINHLSYLFIVNSYLLIKWNITLKNRRAIKKETFFWLKSLDSMNKYKEGALFQEQKLFSNKEGTLEGIGFKSIFRERFLCRWLNSCAFPNIREDCGPEVAFHPIHPKFPWRKISPRFFFTIEDVSRAYA